MSAHLVRRAAALAAKGQGAADIAVKLGISFKRARELLGASNKNDAEGRAFGTASPPEPSSSERPPASARAPRTEPAAATERPLPVPAAAPVADESAAGSSPPAASPGSGSAASAVAPSPGEPSEGQTGGSTIAELPAPSAAPEGPAPGSPVTDVFRDVSSLTSAGASSEAAPAVFSGGGIWTAELEAALRAVWAEGYSAADCARRLGITKNAVVGKAHRMGLPSRPSPIKPKFLAAAEVQPIVRDAEIAGCRWIDGPPRGARTVYCGREQRPGSAYCQPHHARCYVPVARRAATVKRLDAIGYRLPAAGTSLADEIPEIA